MDKVIKHLIHKKYVSQPVRNYVQTLQTKSQEKIRNIGILAHIDAGKKIQYFS